MAYPTLSELTTFLSGQGFTASASASGALSAAIADWERRTGFDPFIAEVSSSEYTFDPPFEDPLLRLDFGGGFADIDSVEIDGNEFTEGAEGDYLNVLLFDTSIIGLRFLSFPGRAPATVVVTGRRGYGDTVPDDVYRAVLQRAAALEIPACSKGAALASEVKQGGIDVKFDTTAGRGKVDQFNDYFKTVARRYRT